MIVSLIGYRATGKSTIGRLLAAELDLPFFDSDRVIVDKVGRTIADIFQQDGEAEFRRIESQVVAELMSSKQAVIAWGGGVVLNEANRKSIKRSQYTFWLQASAENILQRIEQDENSLTNRPALTDLDALQEIQLLLDSRESAYRATADSEIETDGRTADEIVEELARTIAKNGNWYRTDG